MDLGLEELVTELLHPLLHPIAYLYNLIPYSDVVLEYVKKNYRNDPVRVILEGFLVVFALKYVLSKRYKIGTTEITLTDAEIEDLIEEWQPEPLVDVKMLEESEEDRVTLLGPSGIKVDTDKGPLINFSSFNFLGFAMDKDIQAKAIQGLRKYGVGTCGPPGFYGTLDVHLDLETRLAQFLGTEASIIYAQGFSTISSVIPAFSKRGDLIVCDEGVSFPVQKGVQISRSHVRYFRHNDPVDLERVLEIIAQEDSKKKTKLLNRRFIIIEGVYPNTGNIAPLLKILNLRDKYKYRLIIDESFSFGCLGKSGKGITEHFGISASCVDIIAASMANSLASAGGFCAGSVAVVDHQRLSGSAYCFSASMPALLSIASREALMRISPERVANLSHIKETFVKKMDSISLKHFELFGDMVAPLCHLRIKSRYRPSTIKEENLILQKIVLNAMKSGILLTRAKYSPSQELNSVRPCIRISFSSGHCDKDVDLLVECLSKAIEEID